MYTIANDGKNRFYENGYGLLVIQYNIYFNHPNYNSFSLNYVAKAANTNFEFIIV